MRGQGYVILGVRVPTTSVGARGKGSEGDEGELGVRGVRGAKGILY